MGRGVPLALRPSGFVIGGEQTFLLGANYSGLFGQNFGATAWFPEGNGFHARRATLEADLREMAAHGIRLVRLGLLDDGRAVLDAAGKVTGYDGVFRADVSALLDALQTNRMYAVLTLLDYTVCSPGRMVSGVSIHGRRDLLTVPERRTAFVDRLLKPFLSEFGAREPILAFDLMNEPYWLAAGEEGGRWEFVEHADLKPARPVPLADLVAFLRGCAAAIRESPARGKAVTVGDARGLLRSLTALELDYYTLHWYGDPDRIADMARMLPDDRPWMLGEFPLVVREPEAPSPADYLRAARASGAAAAFFWNWTPNPDDPRTPRTAVARRRGLAALSGYMQH